MREPTLEEQFGPQSNDGLPVPRAALPPVRSEPMLAPEHLRVWQDIVDMCKRGGWSSINVASKQRMAAIIAVDEALRANNSMSGHHGLDKETT